MREWGAITLQYKEGTVFSKTFVAIAGPKAGIIVNLLAPREFDPKIAIMKRRVAAFTAVHNARFHERKA